MVLVRTVSIRLPTIRPYVCKKRQRQPESKCVPITFSVGSPRRTHTRQEDDTLVTPSRILRHAVYTSHRTPVALNDMTFSKAVSCYVREAGLRLSMRTGLRIFCTFGKGYALFQLSSANAVKSQNAKKVALKKEPRISMKHLQSL